MQEDETVLFDLSEIPLKAKSVKTLRTKIAGACLSLLTGLLWMGSNIVFKKMKIDFSDLMFMRAIFQTGIFLFIIKMKGRPVWVYSVDETNNLHMIRILQVSQGIVSGVLLISYLLAVSLMNIGDAMAIYFSSFLPTMILSRIFLKEKIGLYKILCASMILTGIILVLKPSLIIYDVGKNQEWTTTSRSTSNNLENNTVLSMTQEVCEKYHIAEISAITSMLSLSILSIITTFLYKNSSTNSTEQSVLYSGIGILFLSLVTAFLGGNQRILFAAKYTKPYNTLEWMVLVMIAIASVVMVFMRFFALKLIGATIENFIFTSEIVFGYEAQVVFFGAIPDNMSIVGSLCITLSCLIIPIEELVISQFPKRVQRYL